MKKRNHTGRQPIGPIIHTAVPVEMLAELDDICAETRESRASVVREALRQYLAGRKATAA